MLYFWDSESSTPIWYYANINRLSEPSISDDGSSIVVSDWGTGEVLVFENSEFTSNLKWRIPSINGVRIQNL